MPHPQRVPSTLPKVRDDQANLDTQRYMAGRIAHDLNNYLTAILGYGELLQGLLQVSSKENGFLDEILLASERAQDFARQLQAFSGRLIMDPECTDLNELLQDIEDDLLDVLPDGVHLELDVSSTLPALELDLRHARSMLRWLVQDACLAMHGTGRIRIRTEPLTNFAGDGSWIVLVFEDTGDLPAATLQSCYFEPFVPGDGLPKGIARAGVAGVVHHHGGHIELQASENDGRRIRIRLPAC